MALVNFLFGNRFPSGFQVGSFQADLTIEEQHEFTSEVTKYPVEDGGTANDAVLKSPKRLTLIGFITETPAAPLALFGRKVTDVYKTLSELYDKSEPVTVLTAYGKYDDMVITRLLMPRESPASMEFTIEMEQVRILQPATVSISSLAQSVKDIAAGIVDAGRQTGSPSSGSTGDAAQSILSRFL